MSSKRTPRRTKKNSFKEIHVDQEFSPRKRGLVERIQWLQSVIRNNNNSNEPSLMNKIRIALSPFQRYYCPSVMSDETASERQKIANKCTPLMSAWACKRIWRLLFGRSRFVHELASARHTDDRAVFSQTVVDMFPLQSLVDGWEPFIKNLFAVARLKPMSRCFWDMEEPRESHKAKIMENMDTPMKASVSWESPKKKSTGRSKSVRFQSSYKIKSKKVSKKKTDRPRKTGYARRTKSTSHRKSR